jgi:hypothetical protein
MTDFLSRAGPSGRARSPSFRDSLAALRERLCDGLAEATSRAAAQAVCRLAASLLGGDDESVRQPDAFGSLSCEYGNTGLVHGYEDEPGWDDDPWHAWGGRPADEHDQDAGAGEPGTWRRVAAACCQALAWLVKTLSPGSGPLGPLACAALAVLALLLGGRQFACEAGLALAEAAWSLAESLTAAPDPVHET